MVEPGDTIVTSGWQLRRDLVPLPVRDPDRRGHERRAAGHRALQADPGRAVRRLRLALRGGGPRRAMIARRRQGGRARDARGDRPDRVRERVRAGRGPGRRARCSASSGSRSCAARSSAPCAGFFAGLLVDTMTLGTLGLTSLLLTLGGYWAGRLRRGDDESPEPARAHPHRGHAAHDRRRGRLADRPPLLGDVGLGRNGRRPRAPAFAGSQPGRSRSRRTALLPPALPAAARVASGSWSLSSASPRAGASSRAIRGSRSRTASRRRRRPASPSSASSRSSSSRVLFFRLWALQVISGDEYLETAQGQPDPHVPPPAAARADRSTETAIVLVSNVPGTVVQLWPAYVPDGPPRRGDRASSSELLDVPAQEHPPPGAEPSRDDPLTPVVVKTNVHDDKANYIREHQTDFPGVEVAPTQLRRYEQGALASHLLGYVGEIRRAGARSGSARGTRAATGSARAGSSGPTTPTCAASPAIGQVRVNALNEATSAPSPEPAPHGRLRRAPDHRRRAPARGRGGASATGIELARGGGQLGRERRRDRGHGSARRRDATRSRRTRPTTRAVFAGVPSQEKYDRALRHGARRRSTSRR